MPSKDENKDYSKISMRIGDVHVEFEGTSENIKKLMEKETVALAKKMEATAKQVPPSSKPSTTSGTPGKKTGKPGKKGTNWRNMATAMVIACIVLLASLVGAIAFYWPTVDDLNVQVAEKDLSITGLTENVTDLTDQLEDLQNSLNKKDATIANLQDAIEPLNSVIEYYLSVMYMNETSYLVQPSEFTMNASELHELYQVDLDYAGYTTFSIESTSNTTYVQLSYAYKGVIFDQNVTVGESGTAYFPVLPTIITIQLGNTDVYTGDSINGTVTARYYY
jgi:uncharacterized coiled-coil protein SlyX